MRDTRSLFPWESVIFNPSVVDGEKGILFPEKNARKRFMNYWNWSDLTENMRFVSLMNSQADKDSVWELPGL